MLTTVINTHFICNVWKECGIFRQRNLKASAASRCFFSAIQSQNECAFLPDRHGSQISQDWNAVSQNCLCPQMIKIVYAPMPRASASQEDLCPLVGKITRFLYFTRARDTFYSPYSSSVKSPRHFVLWSIGRTYSIVEMIYREIKAEHFHYDNAKWG